MRGLAVIVSVLAVLPMAGCDLVFAPGPGPSTTGDGRVEDGPPGADARADADPNAPDADHVEPDAVVSVPDAEIIPDAPPPPPDASHCSAVFTCYAPDFSSGDPPPVGQAGCEEDPDDSCPGLPQLDEIDLCSCTAGTPEFYVEPGGNIGVILFIADPPASNWSLVSSTDGGCRGGSSTCSHDGPCFPGTPLWVWTGVPTTLGATNTFQIFDDDGSGCFNAPVYTFTVSL